MSNSDRIDQWRARSGLAGPGSDAEQDPTRMSDAELRALIDEHPASADPANTGSPDTSAEPAPAPEPPDSPPDTPVAAARPADDEERLRQWRLERQRVGEAKRAERLEHARQHRETRAQHDKDRERAPSLASAGTSTPAPEAAKSSAEHLDRLRRELHERERKRGWQRFGGLLLLLLLALSILFWQSRIATHWATSTASFSVQVDREDEQPALGVLQLGSAPTMTNAFKVREYILSSEMMRLMQQQAGFMDHYRNPHIDFLSRLGSPWAWHEDPLAYYRERVQVTVDTQEGLLRLSVEALTPDAGKGFARRLLTLAEAHVNRINERARTDQTRALEADITQAEQDLTAAREALSAAQQRQGILEPQASAAGVYQLRTSLEGQLAEVERERTGLLQSGLDMSPLLPRLDNQIKSLKRQISEQNARLVGTKGEGSIQGGISELDAAVTRRDIAQVRWETALKTLQDARLQILRERVYLTVVSPPDLAAAPAWWHGFVRWLVLLLVLGLAHSAWTIWSSSRRLQT